MKPIFVDTNVFIRYLTNDDPVKADRVELLLQQAAKGEVLLLTSEIVMAEVVWVLESFYGLKNKVIAPMITAILATSGLEVLNAPLVEKAIDHYQNHNIDFIDGYIAAVMAQKGIDKIFSYDKKHLSRIQEVVRTEP